MEVMDALPGIRPGVHHHAESARRHPVRGGELPGHLHGVSEGCLVFRPQRIDAGDMPAGDDQEMHRRLGRDVPESEHRFVAVDDVSGNVSAGDTAEQAVLHYAFPWRGSEPGQNARTVPASTVSGTFCSQAPTHGPQTHWPVAGS